MAPNLMDEDLPQAFQFSFPALQTPTSSVPGQAAAPTTPLPSNNAATPTPSSAPALPFGTLRLPSTAKTTKPTNIIRQPQNPSDVTTKNVQTVVEAKLVTKEYILVITSPLPYAPWAPLPPNMRHDENRPCHCSYSNLHQLICGHYILAPTLSICTANCLGMWAHVSEHSQEKMSKICHDTTVEPCPTVPLRPENGGHPGMVHQNDRRDTDSRWGCLICVRVAMNLLPEDGFREPGKWLGLLRDEFRDANEVEALRGSKECVPIYLFEREGKEDEEDERIIIPLRTTMDAAVSRALEDTKLRREARQGKKQQDAQGDILMSLSPSQLKPAPPFDFTSVPKGPKSLSHITVPTGPRKPQTFKKPHTRAPPAALKAKKHLSHPRTTTKTPITADQVISAVSAALRSRSPTTSSPPETPVPQANGLAQSKHAEALTVEKIVEVLNARQDQGGKGKSSSGAGRRKSYPADKGGIRKRKMVPREVRIDKQRREEKARVLRRLTDGNRDEEMAEALGEGMSLI